MPTFPLELVSPEKLIFAGEVEAVVVPGTEGEFTVLKDHAPVMAMLRPGIIEIDQTATQKTRLFVRRGFAEVSPAGLTILAEQAIPLDELECRSARRRSERCRRRHRRCRDRRGAPHRDGTARPFTRI